MPVIRVEMWSGRSHAQKRELARSITEAMVNITQTTPKDAIIIIFEDIPKEHWAQGGVLASDLEQ
ncbi:MAG: 2-hydroxymuconate tautomerase [Dehalococcoidia bacterium]